MTLSDLVGPIAASAGIGVLFGTARANNESAWVLGLLIAVGLIVGFGLVAASRYLSRRRLPKTEGQAATALVLTFVFVLAGTWLAGEGILAIGHHLL